MSRSQTLNHRSPAAVLTRLAILVTLLCTFSGVTAPLAAQDNPIPLNYRNLTVKAFEVNNNRNDAMRGVQVTINPQKGDKLVRFPKQATINGASGRRFSKIPPSSVVGPYTITAVSKDCGTQTKKFNKNGGSDQIVTFTFTRCGKSGEIANEFARRSQGGYDVIVKLRESGGTRGNGYWVWAYDSKNNLVKKIRSSGTGKAEFRALDPNGAPYRFDVFRINNQVATYKLNQLNRNQLVDIDLNQGGGNQGGNSPSGARSYDLRVKIDTPLMVYLKNNQGKTVAKKEYSSNGVNFRGMVSGGGKYKVEFYLGNKKVASYDYSMPNRNSSVSYRLDK